MDEHKHLWAHPVGSWFDRCVECSARYQCVKEDGPAHTPPETMGLRSTVRQTAQEGK